jgi:hypothetical protein
MIARRYTYGAGREAEQHVEPSFLAAGLSEVSRARVWTLARPSDAANDPAHVQSLRQLSSRWRHRAHLRYGAEPGAVPERRADRMRRLFAVTPKTGARHLNLLKGALLQHWTKEPTRAQRPINVRSSALDQ